MRSQQDPHFSDLCDRIGRGKITEEDIKHLKTMVRNTDSENFNENFKNGSLSIIVTTNRKRNFINSQKLAELLPNEKEYTCNSIDQVTNVPTQGKLPSRLKDNPGNTGNLLTELSLKVGALLL